MRLGYSKSKNTIQFYAIKDTRKKGKRSTKIVKRLGNLQEVTRKAKGEDPYIWAKKYIDELNKKEEKNTLEVIAKFSESKLIKKNTQKNFNCGYLFLQKLYYGLNLDKMCKEISGNYKFKYDLNSILSRLIYTRILEPSSKQSSFESSKKFIEQPNFELHDVYRALEVISTETEYIEKFVYQSSLNLVNRNTKILYYDCTNYFFEIEQADGLKQYGVSKEHRPNPIVQMGLIMDGDGFPLAFTITDGNTNEQLTLKPLEEQIIKDFSLSKFVMCTDAGLASQNNRIFNNIQNRSFIVTQSLKKIKGHIQEWALSKEEWHSFSHPKKKVNLEEIDNSSDNEEIYFKERWIKENGLEQRLIVTYSPKYAAYQKSVRQAQVMRAQAYIESPSQLNKNRQTDPKRFIKSTKVTKDGEIAEKNILTINQDAIDKEAMFDGYYAVCTTLEDDVKEIIKVNRRRWEIEESFRILKTEFKARPVYLKRDDRIKAHFTICFLSLLIYRILENKLENKYTTENILETLKNMDLTQIDEEYFIPTYIRTDLTDDLHKFSGFRTDKETLSIKSLKKIYNLSKK